MPDTILLVEDDEFIRDSVSRLLSGEGYAVAACADLRQARDALRRRLPDLVILDVLLPDGSGFDLCREIRLSDPVPILFLTCCDEEEAIVRGLEDGGDDYLTKPFRSRVLLSHVHALLRRSRTESAAVLHAGVLRFACEQQQCTLRGQMLPLTPTEYRILFTLAKAAGAPVPRQELLHAVWALGSEYMDENTLAVHISRLRAKLGADSGRLVHVRGEGYRLRCDDV